MSFYSVTRGKKTGVYKTWKECQMQVKGFSGAIYKKFDTLEEAEEFIQLKKKSVKKSISESESDIELETETESKKVDYYVYTDGACVNNGKKNAKAGYGIYFGENDKRNVSKRIIGKQTNNVAELTAIIETYKIIENDINSKMNIVIFTDSKYALKCVGSYGKKQELNDWKDDIPNKELVKQIYTIYKGIKNVEFRHIRAHTGKEDIHSIGNDNADRLAVLSVNNDMNSVNDVNDSKYIKKEKIYLNVKYEDKEVVKNMGGKWDKNKKKWYIYDNNKNIKEILKMFQ